MRTILFLLLIPSIAFAAPRHRSTPTPTPTPVPTPKTEWVCRTKQKDAELRDWIGGLMNQVHEAQADAAAAKKTNADAVHLLGMSIEDAAKVISQCAADKECAKAPLSCWFHRLVKHIFWMIGVLVILAVALLILNFFFPFLGPTLSFIAAIWARILGMFKPKPPTP